MEQVLNAPNIDLRSKGKVVEERQPILASRDESISTQRRDSVTEDHAFLMDPFVGSKFEDNYFVIMDKGASDISSCNEDYSETGMHAHHTHLKTPGNDEMKFFVLFDLLFFRVNAFLVGAFNRNARLLQ